jgi:hypothetical protein
LASSAHADEATQTERASAMRARRNGMVCSFGFGVEPEDYTNVDGKRQPENRPVIPSPPPAV